MTSTVLVKDVLWRVGDQLFDTNPQFSRWTQRSLVNHMNDAQRVIAKFLPHSCARVDAIKLVPGTKQSIAAIPAAQIVNGDGTTSADLRGYRLLDLIRNLGADGATPGNAVRPGDRKTLDVADPAWHTRTAKSVSQVFYDPQSPKVFYVYPGVDPTTPMWVEVSWLPDPLDIPVGTLGTEYVVTGTDITKLSVDDRNVDDVVNYILARAELRDAEFAGSLQVAGSYAASFVSSINTQAVAFGLPNPKLTSLPLVAQAPQ